MTGLPVHSYKIWYSRTIAALHCQRDLIYTVDLLSAVTLGGAYPEAGLRNLLQSARQSRVYMCLNRKLYVAENKESAMGSLVPFINIKYSHFLYPFCSSFSLPLFLPSHPPFSPVPPENLSLSLSFPFSYLFPSGICVDASKATLLSLLRCSLPCKKWSYFLSDCLLTVSPALSIRL